MTLAALAASERTSATIEQLRVSAYTIPTDAPEADGTFAWSSTTLVLVEASSQGVTGLGYTYADIATAHFIDAHLADVVQGRDAMDVAGAWQVMVRAIRNQGRPGVSSMAIAAVDTALWDLKARLLELPLVRLWGAIRDRVEIYGSGGFTSYSIPTLQKQLHGWAAKGMRYVKMKIGSDPAEDIPRVRFAREAIGEGTGLFVDANGAYTHKQAMAYARAFERYEVSWFEEPVSSDDLAGLHWLRHRGPAGMDIAAGEYGYDLPYFMRMLHAEAVDVLQADVTRCAGYTEFFRVAALCEATQTPLSCHCAPSLHLPIACAAPLLRHIEYFHDHARIEHMFFEGAAEPSDGVLTPNLQRPGHGLLFLRSEAKRYAIYGNA